MERRAFRLKINPGRDEDYIRLHQQVTPELLSLFDEQGIRNYTIWYGDHEVFGYYEVEDPEKADRIGAASNAPARWGEIMEGVVADPGTAEPPYTPELRCVFRFRADDEGGNRP
jgi:L-rhamnose mutarotase